MSLLPILFLAALQSAFEYFPVSSSASVFQMEIFSAVKRHENMISFLVHIDEEINGGGLQASPENLVEQSVLGKRLRTV